jgi:hypothetical protein
MDKLQGSPVVNQGIKFVIDSAGKLANFPESLMGGSYGFTIVVIDHPHVVFMVGINSKGS